MGTDRGMRWLTSRKFKAPGRQVYSAVAAVARQPVLFEELAVPDTLDGRFDAVVLHLVLLMRRLESLGREGHMLARHIVGVFVDDMDRTVREMGIGDLSVGKQVKRMARALYGRFEAYDAALKVLPERKPLEEALGRNLYAGRKQADGVLARTANYVDALNRRIEQKSLNDFLKPEFFEALTQATGEAAREARSCPS